jgi:hypothetical protein
MAAKVKTVANDANVVAITESLNVEVGKLGATEMDFSDATEAKNVAGEARTNMREIVLTEIAKLSADNQWREIDIKASIKRIKGKGNSGTLATYYSEVAAAANPRVCAVFPALVQMRDALWPQEPDETHEVNTDCAKVWSRRYQMLTAMARAVKNNEATFVSTGDVIAYAQENDPAHDATKIQKRLDKISEELTEFFGDFPHEDLSAAASLVAEIDVKQLQAAREKVTGETEKRLAGHKLADVARARAKPVTPEVKPATPDVGVVDIDDLLGDNLELKAA